MNANETNKIYQYHNSLIIVILLTINVIPGNKTRVIKSVNKYSAGINKERHLIKEETQSKNILHIIHVQELGSVHLACNSAILSGTPVVKSHFVGIYLDCIWSVA